MTHKMGLAHVTLNQRTGVVASRVVLNGAVQNQSSESTSSVRASGNFLTNLMYNKSNECYFIMKPGTDNAKTFDCTERTEATAWIDAWTTSVGENECKHFDATVRPYTNYTANFSYSGQMKSISTPMKCDYTMECWGAGGGKGLVDGVSFTNGPGKGGYTYGEISLSASINLYVYVGGKGGDMLYNSSTKKTYQDAPGGWNGGGLGAYDRSDDDGDGGGGGATDIRLSTNDASASTWNDFTSLKSRIMVAGGGGGGGYRVQHGGCGGNTTGGSAWYQESGQSKVTVTTINPGSQTSGYKFGQGQDGRNNPSVKNNTSAGGGGGYYGGQAHQNSPGLSSNSGYPAPGGSSYISGYTGCNAIKQDASSDGGGDSYHTGSPDHYSGKVFSNGNMIDGDNSMPKYSGSGNMTGNSSDGYARIKFLKVTR